MDSAAQPLILAQAAPDAFLQMVPLVMILAVFYFLLIRPQQQKAKEHEEYLKGLKRGETVVSSSGIYGRIVDLKDDEVTLEGICEKLIIYGTPDKVADDLLRLQEEVGEFGTLLYAGKDWKDRELGRRSMILMAEEVMPHFKGK